MTEAVSVAAAYAEALTRASEGASAEALAEAVAVSAAVLVGRSIGHLVRCRYFPCSFWYVFRTYAGLYVGDLLTDLNKQ